MMTDGNAKPTEATYPRERKKLFCLAILFAMAVLGGCQPKATPPVLIRDGTVVLLRSGVTNGVFVVTKQGALPEVVDYTWFLRSDGAQTFGTNDPAVASGAVSGATSIAFGPFHIQWSTAGSFGGYVYYPQRHRWIRMPWGKYWAIKTLGGPAMAITTERDAANIDANDPRWKFQR